MQVLMGVTTKPQNLLKRLLPRAMQVALAFAVPVLTPAVSWQAQSSATGYVPSPDPGYGLYYHDSDGSPNPATRWGYHDGWEDGRHDRNHGEPVADIKGKDRYATPPKHDGHAVLSREQYVKQYRSAYLHGYEHGSRL